MTDWALYGISLQNERIDRATSSATALRAASLTFCVTGTLFFLADGVVLVLKEIGGATNVDIKDILKVAPMITCCVLFVEDIPQVRVGTIMCR